MAFQSSLMFVGKAKAYPRGELLSGATLWWAPALHTNIRLIRKGKPGTLKLISEYS